MKRTLLAIIGLVAVTLGSSAFAADLRIGGSHVFVPVPRILLPPPILLPPGVAYVGAGDYYDRRWDGRDWDNRHWNDRRWHEERYGWRDHDRHDYDHDRSGHDRFDHDRWHH